MGARLFFYSLVMAFMTFFSSSAYAFSVGLQQDSHLSTGPSHSVRKTVKEMKTLGAGHVRTSVFWHEVAAKCQGQSVKALSDDQNPCYNWKVPDTVIHEAKANNMQVVWSVRHKPTWLLPGGGFTYTGKDWKEFTVFAKHVSAFHAAAAKRYNHLSKIGYVKYWSVWNEPNSHTFWQPNPYYKNASHPDHPAKRYAHLYVVTSLAIKKQSPQAMVALGPLGASSLPYKPIPYLRAVRHHLSKIKSAQAVDAIAINPYQKGDPRYRYHHNWSKTLAKDIRVAESVGLGSIEDLFAVMDETPHFQGKEVWILEFSYETNPPDPDRGVSYATQAKWMGLSIHKAHLTGRIPLFGWYVYKDPSYQARPLDWNSGVMTTEGLPKPSYRAFQYPMALQRFDRENMPYVKVWAFMHTFGEYYGPQVFEPGIAYADSPAGPWIYIPGSSPVNGVSEVEVSLDSPKCFTQVGAFGAADSGAIRCANS